MLHSDKIETSILCLVQCLTITLTKKELTVFDRIIDLAAS